MKSTLTQFFSLTVVILFIVIAVSLLPDRIISEPDNIQAITPIDSVVAKTENNVFRSR